MIYFVLIVIENFTLKKTIRCYGVKVTYCPVTAEPGDRYPLAPQSPVTQEVVGSNPAWGAMNNYFIIDGTRNHDQIYNWFGDKPVFPKRAWSKIVKYKKEDGGCGVVEAHEVVALEVGDRNPLVTPDSSESHA